MNIIHILPELHEGGVERIVPVAANAQAAMGHKVLVASNGGRLKSLLSPGVRHIKMPSHKKNALTGMLCASRLAELIREEKISVIHAHSRVPGWIAYFARKFARDVKFIYTAHSRFGTLNIGCWPISRADGVTCVSNAVLRHMANWLPSAGRTRVIYNPMPTGIIPWRGSGDGSKKHLLFLGRLSSVKGVIDLARYMAAVKNDNWTLDIIGDGPAMAKLTETIHGLRLEDRVFPRGFSDNAAGAIAACDLFLFPSHDEGLPLALVEALVSGAPVLASDIPAVRELVSLSLENPNGELLPPEDVFSWAGAIDRFLLGEFYPSLRLERRLPTAEEMAAEMIGFYEHILAGKTPDRSYKTDIIHILPEMGEGGVERLVPVIANGQAAMGYNVDVVSHGGKLESLLSDRVRHIKLPAHRKNPITGLYCAFRLASLARRENVWIIHAHSRVPAWISYLTKKLAPGVIFIYTAHARFASRNFGCWPIKKADGVICVSNAVRAHLKDWLPPDGDRVTTIYNSLPRPITPWRGSGDRLRKHLLFVGRIVDRKDPLTLVEALSSLKDREWALDVLGDGPLMKNLRERVEELGLADRIILRGFSDMVAEAISTCDAFIFPSLDEEGLGLSLLEALLSGAPVIASDIPTTREITSLEMENPNGELLPARDVTAWENRLERFFDGKFSPALSCAITIPLPGEMASDIIRFYERIAQKNKKEEA